MSTLEFPANVDLLHAHELPRNNNLSKEQVTKVTGWIEGVREKMDTPSMSLLGVLMAYRGPATFKPQQMQDIAAHLEHLSTVNEDLYEARVEALRHFRVLRPADDAGIHTFEQFEGVDAVTAMKAREYRDFNWEPILGLTHPGKLAVNAGIGAIVVWVLCAASLVVGMRNGERREWLRQQERQVAAVPMPMDAEDPEKDEAAVIE